MKKSHAPLGLCLLAWTRAALVPNAGRSSPDGVRAAAADVRWRTSTVHALANRDSEEVPAGRVEELLKALSVADGGNPKPEEKAAPAGPLARVQDEWKLLQQGEGETYEFLAE